MGSIISVNVWKGIPFFVLLLLAAVALVPLGLVTVKMLPFDDKNEFQVIGSAKRRQNDFTLSSWR